MYDRRRFLAVAGTGALAAGLSAIAQQRVFRVGWLASTALADGLPLLDALRQGLRELGYVEGRNLVLDARWASAGGARPETVAAELVTSNPDVIVTLGPVAMDMRRATTTIPIVFGFSGDPVQAGFVRSLAAPGGNMTGISFLALELVGKRIELLKAVMPELRRIAIVANAQHPGDQAERRASEAAAAAAGLEIEYFETASAAQLDSALIAMPKSRCEAAVMFPIQTIIGNSARIAAWSVRRRIPAISGWAQFAQQGNLMSYGANVRESFRRLATSVDKILKGARPAELPVELPLNIELVVNLKAAKALGVTVPPSVMLRADQVIE